MFVTENKLLAFKWGNTSYDRSVALVQFSHRLNSHGLFKPNEKKCICAVFKSMLLSCLISVPASTVCEKLSSSLETHPSDSQLCVSSAVFVHSNLQKNLFALSGGNSRKQILSCTFQIWLQFHMAACVSEGVTSHHCSEYLLWIRLSGYQGFLKLLPRCYKMTSVLWACFLFWSV